MRSVFAPSPITPPLPSVAVPSASRGLVAVCLPGGVVTGASLRHCHAEAAPQLLFFYIYFPRDGENLGGGCLQLTCGPVSRGETAAIMAALLYRFGNLFCAPPWQSILYHFGNPWIHFYIKFQ